MNKLSSEKCLRCGHVWLKRILAKPKQCPNCKSTSWDKPRVRGTK